MDWIAFASQALRVIVLLSIIQYFYGIRDGRARLIVLTIFLLFAFLGIESLVMLICDGYFPCYKEVVKTVVYRLGIGVTLVMCWVAIELRRRGE